MTGPHDVGPLGAALPQAVGPATTGALLGMLVGFNYSAIRANVDGVTHEESLLDIRPAGNCLNWVMGHIVGSRNDLLARLGAGALWPADAVHLYSGREPGLFSPARALHLTRITDDLAHTQELVMAALAALTPKDLAARDAKRQPLDELIGFFQFHESYHAGQVGLIRRILGKPPALECSSAPLLSA